MANKKYLSDYAFRDPEDKKKGFDYVGQYYYRIAPDEKSFRKLKIRYWIFIGAELALYAAAGVLSNPGMVTFYEAMPYAVNFLPLFLSLIAVMDIAFSPLDMTRKAADISVKRLRSATIFAFALALAAALSSLGFLLFARGGASPLREAVFLALELGLAFTAYLFMGAQGKAGITEIPNPLYLPGAAGEKRKLS